MDVGFISYSVISTMANWAFAARHPRHGRERGQKLSHTRLTSVRGYAGCFLKAASSVDSLDGADKINIEDTQIATLLFVCVTLD